MLIKSIRPKGQNKMTVVFSSGNKFVFFDETVFEFNFVEGNEISTDVFKAAKEKSDEKLSFDFCLSQIEKEMKTKAQLKKKLIDKKFSFSAIKKTLEKLDAYSFSGDEKFAQNFCQSAQNKKGKKRIAFELAEKGVDREVIENVISQIGNQTNVAETFAKKFFAKNERNKKNEQKIWRQLASKGFSFEEISAAIKPNSFEEMEEGE